MPRIDHPTVQSADSHPYSLFPTPLHSMPGSCPPSLLHLQPISSPPFFSPHCNTHTHTLSLSLSHTHTESAMNYSALHSFIRDFSAKPFNTVTAASVSLAKGCMDAKVRAHALKYGGLYTTTSKTCPMSAASFSKALACCKSHYWSAPVAGRPPSALPPPPSHILTRSPSGPTHTRTRPSLLFLTPKPTLPLSHRSRPPSSSQTAGRLQTW
jgi:hypothetical protein